MIILFLAYTRYGQKSNNGNKTGFEDRIKAMSIFNKLSKEDWLKIGVAISVLLLSVILFLFALNNRYQFSGTKDEMVFDKWKKETFHIDDYWD